MKIMITMFFAMTLLVCISAIRAQEVAVPKSYDELYRNLDAKLTPVFRSLGDFGELQQYFDQDQKQKTSK